MQKENSKKVGVASATLVAVLSFGAFVAGLTVLTGNRLSLTAETFADDGESGGNSGSGSGGSQDSGSSSSGSNSDSTKNAEKDAIKKQEDARKQLERSSRGSNDDFSNDRVNGVKLRGDGSVDDNQNGIGGDDTNTDGDDNENDNNGMFKDRAKTLSKLQEEIAKTRENILKKQAEGADVTTALARLALAEAGLAQVGSSFDANDLETAKRLAKEIKKTAHFAEKDLQNAKKVAEEVAKVEKRFGQVDKKIASFESLGGDASAFKAQLASLRSDFSVLKASIAAAPGTITRDTVKAFEKRVKRLKSLVESSIFALGGTDDDDLFEDHEEDSADLSEDLDDVAEIEDGDDNGVSGKVRKVAAEHKAASQAIKGSLEDIKGRDGIVRVIFGPDRSALDGLTAQIAAMNTRADALDAAALQITDLQVKQILVDQAAALRSEAAKLQAYITSEDNQFSIFGKLIKLFRQ